MAVFLNDHVAFFKISGLNTIDGRFNSVVAPGPEKLLVVTELTHDTSRALTCCIKESSKITISFFNDDGSVSTWFGGFGHLFYVGVYYLNYNF